MVGQPQYSSASLYVGDLPPDVTEAMLYEIFNPIGAVQSIRVCRESNSRRSLGYAYINYHSIGDAQKCLDTLNYTPIKGIPCRIMWSHRDPALRKSGAGNIFVKNLDKVIDTKALHDTFSIFGTILSCKVAQDEYGKSKGYGFVHYENENSAKLAIDRINGMSIGTKKVYVCPFKKNVERPNTRSTYFTNLYVKHLHEAWTEETVNRLFSAYGPIKSMVVSTDPKGRRFALINFETAQSAQNAVLDLHGRKVNSDGVDLPDEDHAKILKLYKASIGEFQENESEGYEETSASAAEKETLEEIGASLEEKSSTDHEVNSRSESQAEKQHMEQKPVSTLASSDASDMPVTTDDQKDSTALSESKRTDEASVQIPVNTQVEKESTEGPLNVDEPSETTHQQKQLDEPPEPTGESNVNQKSKPESEEQGAIDYQNITEDRLYVQRAMTKAERVAILKETFTAAKEPASSKVSTVNLYVKNLDDSVTDEILREAFSKFGTVLSAKVMHDEHGVSKGFGFVSFAFSEEATKAVTAMHLKIFCNKPLYVGLAERRQSRTARLQQRYRSQAGGGMEVSPTMRVSPTVMPAQQMRSPMAIPGSQPMMYQSSTGTIPSTMYYSQQAIDRSNTSGPFGAPTVGFPAQTGAAPPYVPAVAWRRGQQLPPSIQTASSYASYPGAPYNSEAAVMAMRENYPGVMNPNRMRAAEPQSKYPTAMPQPMVAQDQFRSSFKVFADAHPQVQKQILGERLFPLVAKHQPKLAGKITGMILEMDNSELLTLLDSESLLSAKVEEAVQVLQRHQHAVSAPQPA